MKKLIIFSVTCFVIIAACTKKVAPVIASRTEFPEPPKTTKSTTAEATPEILLAGKNIYTGKCVRCHDAKEPGEFNAQRWESILKSMIPKAKLNEQQANEVRAYVMANAKK